MVVALTMPEEEAEFDTSSLEDQARLDGPALEGLGLGESVGVGTARDRAIQRVSRLADQQEQWTEQFKSRNALLQNSLAYFGLLSARLGEAHQSSSSRLQQVSVLVSSLAAAILHLTLDTSPNVIADVDNRMRGISVQGLRLRRQTAPPQLFQDAEFAALAEQLLRRDQRGESGRNSGHQRLVVLLGLLDLFPVGHDLVRIAEFDEDAIRRGHERHAGNRRDKDPEGRRRAHGDHRRRARVGSRQTLPCRGIGRADRDRQRQACRAGIGRPLVDQRRRTNPMTEEPV